MIFTFQTRVSAYADLDRAAGNAVLYGRVQQEQFADMASSRSAASLKNAYLERYRIPARMFNGVRVSLEGKVASVREQQKLRVESLWRRIDRAEKQTTQATRRGL